VLVACAPERMAVWDRRVRTALELIGMPVKPGRRYYGRYLERVAELQTTMASVVLEAPLSREGSGAPNPCAGLRSRLRASHV
jgi:hypothetical protein